MTQQEEFITLGKRIFGRNATGFAWQVEMHRQTHAPLRTVQAWANGENPVPEVVLSLMRMVAGFMPH